MYALPVYFEGQRQMLQQVLHRASSRGFNPYYYDLDTLAENVHYHLFRHSRRQAHCLNHLYTVKPRPPGAMQLRLNCLLLNMNSSNETLLFDRFLIMDNLCVFYLYYRHVCISLYTCANVICIKLLLTYLLT